MKNRGLGNLPEWLTEQAASVIAEAAGAALTRRDSPEEAKTAVRAAAVGCLPSLPAPMLAEVVAAVAPTEAPAPDHVPPELAPVDSAELARRLAPLAGGTNVPLGTMAERLAVQLARAGAARLGRPSAAGAGRHSG